MNKIIKQTQRILILIIVAILIIGFINVNSIMRSQANMSNFEVSATSDKIILKGNIEGSGKADIVKLRPYEYFGETTLYHNEEANKIVETSINLGANFEVSIDRFTASGTDKVYDKFCIVQNNKLIADSKQVTNMVSKNNYARREPQTVKGLQVQNTDDAFKLGIQHAAINYTISEMLYQEKPSTASNSIEFKANGKTYYFKKDRVEDFDKQVISLTDNNVEVTIILIIPGGTIARSVKTMIHPKYEGADDVVAQTNGSLAAPNLTDNDGMEYWQSACEFTAERYTRPDKKFGRVLNVVVGNEVDVAGVWNNMSKTSRKDYIDQYVRTLRTTDIAFKKYYSEMNILISLTHAWNAYALDLPNQYENKSYRGKDIVDDVNALTKKEGDFAWGIAYHPYPDNLRDPRFWLAPESVCNDNPLTTKKITFKNLHVLANYLKTDTMKVNGKSRKIYLTEQGLNTYTDSDKVAWPSELGQYTKMKAQKLQAVSYAYSYYLISQIDEIDAYILHRHVDATDEGRPTLSLGLWTCDPNGSQADPLDKKIIYDVFKFIDTNRSLEFSEPLLADGYIRTKDGKVPKTWNDLIDNFDVKKAITRKDFDILSSKLENTISPTFMLDNFENGLNGWRAGEYAKDVETVSEIKVNPMTMIEGKNALKFNFEGLRKQNGGFAEKGVIKEFENGLDISKYKSFEFAVNAPLGAVEGSKYLITVLLYSGYDVKMANIEIQPDQWNIVKVNLEEWKDKQKIDKIKIWFNNDNIVSFNKFIYLDCIGFTADSIWTPAIIISLAIGGVLIIMTTILVSVIIKKNHKKLKKG